MHHLTCLCVDLLQAWLRQSYPEIVMVLVCVTLSFVMAWTMYTSAAEVEMHVLRQNGERQAAHGEHAVT